jgi:hypothetical protein
MAAKAKPGNEVYEQRAVLRAIRMPIDYRSGHLDRLKAALPPAGQVPLDRSQLILMEPESAAAPSMAIESFCVDDFFDDLNWALQADRSSGAPHQ